MSSNSEKWIAALTGCSPSASRQLNQWVNLSDPPELFGHLLAALQRDGEESRFLLDSQLIARALLEPGVLNDEQARAVMLAARRREPLFDAKLLQQLLSGRAWPQEVPYEEVQRCLFLIEAALDPNRVAVPLLRFIRYPDIRVQSKAAKLLGRLLPNLEKLEEIFESPNERVRANLIEGIAHRRDLEALMPLILRAGRDPSTRVSTMGLAVLARQGHKMSQTLLTMRRRSKVDSISWAANFAHDVLVRPYQDNDLERLSSALCGDVETTVMPTIAEVDGEAETHPEDEAEPIRPA